MSTFLATCAGNAGDAGDVPRLLVLAPCPAQAWALTAYLQWKLAPLAPLLVGFEAPDAATCTSTQLLDAVEAAFRAHNLGDKRRGLLVVGLGLGGVAAMLLSSCGWNVLDAITLGSPLRSASLTSFLRRAAPALAGGEAFPLLFSDVQSATSGAAVFVCPSPAHRFCNVTFGLLDNFFVRSFWRAEHCVDDDHALHLTTPDHALSFASPFLWAQVHGRVAETCRLWVDGGGGGASGGR
jgi:hypothetical protein